MTIDNVSPAIDKGRQKLCPFLGFPDDPQTSYFYPSTVNVCHHAKPLVSPNLDHQRLFCINGKQHFLCPVFARSTVAPLPAEIGGPTGKPLVEKRFFLPILIGCAVIILVVIGATWIFTGNRSTGSAPAIKPGSPTPSWTAISLPTDTPPSTDIAITPNLNTATPVTTPAMTETPLTLTPTLTPTLTRVSPVPTLVSTIIFYTPVPCGRPGNWTTYIVQSGDSLYRLSVSFGVTVSQLQIANCMGNSTYLQAGQILYVPAWATVAPPPTSMPTNTPEIILPSDTPIEFPTSMPTDTPIPPEIPTDTLEFPTP